METEKNYLEQNISRLLKLTSDTTGPNPAFRDLLIDSALRQLNQSDAADAALARINIDSVMKIAAMIAVLCGAGVELLLSGLAWFNASLASTVFMVVISNGLTCLGGLIL